MSFIISYDSTTHIISNISILGALLPLMNIHLLIPSTCCRQNNTTPRLNFFQSLDLLSVCVPDNDEFDIPNLFSCQQPLWTTSSPVTVTRPECAPGCLPPSREKDISLQNHDSLLQLVEYLMRGYWHYWCVPVFCLLDWMCCVLGTAKGALL